MMLALSVRTVARFGREAQDRPGQEQAKTDTPAKEPPPPLFPRHRRGLYKDAQGLEVIDATPQSPPLEVDDPSVPDKGQYEINLTFHGDLSRNAQRLDVLLVDANYGMLPTMVGHELPTQLKLELPVAAARENDNPFTLGVGAATFGLKFNFYTKERHGVSVSFYPQLEFVAPGTRGVEKGLADPGQTVIVPLLVSKEFRYLTLVGNSAVHQPVHDPERDTTGALGLGIGRAITRKVAAMIEAHAESAFNFKRDRLVLLNVGLIHGVRNIIVYAQLGRSLFSGDSHTSVSVGMKLLTQPRQK
jgi:hypothetical protein